MTHTNNSMQCLSSSQFSQPQETHSCSGPTQNAILSEPLNPTALVQHGGVTVAVILAVSILILTLAEFTKVVIGATHEN